MGYKESKDYRYHAMTLEEKLEKYQNNKNYINIKKKNIIGDIPSILYHISFAVNKENKKQHFVPCIPKSVNRLEDRVTPRICFSTRIELCIEATGFFPQKGWKIRIYTLDTEKISPRNVVNPYFLKQNYYVPDAVTNMEYWILQDIILTGKDYIIENIQRKQCMAWESITPDMVVMALNDALEKYQNIKIHELKNKVLIQKDDDCRKMTINTYNALKENGLQDICDTFIIELKNMYYTQRAKVCNLKLREI